MALFSLISNFFQNMETPKVSAVCPSMKRYKRRKKYQRLKRIVTNNNTHNHHNEDDHDHENEKISMLEDQYRRRGMMIKSKVKISNLPAPAVELPLRKWRDAYVEMMLCFAGHVTPLNNGNVYLFRRIPKPGASQCLGDYDN